MIKKIFVLALLVCYTFVLYYQIVVFDSTIISFIYILFTALAVMGYLYSVIKSKYGLVFNISNFFSFMGLLILVSLLANLTFLLLMPKDLNIENHLGLLNIYVLFEIIYEMSIFLFLVMLFYKDDFEKQYVKFESNIGSYIVKVIYYYLLAMLLNIVFTVVAGLIPVVDQTPANQEGINKILELDVHFNLYILMTILVAPIVEEFIYRYILIEQIFYKTFLKHLGTFILTILSALIFAFMHAQAASSFIYFIRDLLVYMPFAICLSLLYIKERNIYVNILLHMINNVISVAIVLNMS